MRIHESDRGQLAWDLYERGEYQESERIWHELISEAPEGELNQGYRLSLGYVLVAQKKFDEAETLYRDLYKETKDHIFLHQLCMVFREKGAFEEALAYLRLELSMINDDDHLSLGANAYEFGKINELLGKYDVAKRYARGCMESALATEDTVLKGCAYRLLGDVHRWSDKETALKFYREAIGFFTAVPDQNEVARINKSISEL